MSVLQSEGIRWPCAQRWAIMRCEWGLKVQLNFFLCRFTSVEIVRFFVRFPVKKGEFLTGGLFRPALMLETHPKLTGLLTAFHRFTHRFFNKLLLYFDDDTVLFDCRAFDLS